jgi:hypothetical protein
MRNTSGDKPFIHPIVSELTAVISLFSTYKALFQPLSLYFLVEAPQQCNEIHAVFAIFHTQR